MNIVVQDKEGNRFIEFEAEGSLLHSKNAELIEIIEGTLASKKIQNVVLCQKSPCNTASKEWVNELKYDELSDSLEQKIKRLQNIAAQISESSVTWIYASNSNCYDEFWEIALHCNRRLWFESRSKIGFRFLKFLSEPSLGSFRTIKFSRLRLNDVWRDSDQITAEKALALGLIDFSSNCSEWLDVYRKLSVDMFEVSKSSYVHIEPLQDNLKFEIAVQASEKKLSNSYINQLSKDVLQIKEASNQTRSLQRVSKILIDLDYLPPPTHSLVKLLKSSIQIAFFAANSNALAQSLVLIYSRLEKVLGNSETELLWNRLVTWYQGVINKEEVSLRWTIDGRIHLSCKEDSIKFLRLEGNAKGANCGTFEWSKTESEKLDANHILRQISNLLADEFVVGFQNDNEAIPLSIYIRSLAFAELLKISNKRNSDLGSVVEALNAYKWAFSANADAWDRFLLTRIEAYQSSKVESPFSKSDDFSDMGSWRHAKIRAKSVTPETYWNDVALNKHMAIFAGLVSLYIYRNKKVSSLRDADLICCNALGFPSQYGTPLSILSDLGASRISNYARVHWASLDPNIVGSRDDDFWQNNRKDFKL